MNDPDDNKSYELAVSCPKCKNSFIITFDYDDSSHLAECNNCKYLWEMGIIDLDEE